MNRVVVFYSAYVPPLRAFRSPRIVLEVSRFAFAVAAAACASAAAAVAATAAAAAAAAAAATATAAAIDYPKIGLKNYRGDRDRKCRYIACPRKKT